VLYGLDLFSGIGGITLALAPWVSPIAYCENDQYAQSVLLSRMASGQLPLAPIWDDVSTLRAQHVPTVDIIYGGFPCQDISNAGTRAGLAGERSGLFKEIVRLTSELQPRFVFLENVSAIVSRGLCEVLTAFTELGYDTRWTCLRASDVGAIHERNRWWLLAYANGEQLRDKQRRRGGSSGTGENELGNDGTKEFVAHSAGVGLEGGAETGQRRSGEAERVLPKLTRGSFKRDWWSSEPDVGRVAHGVPYRVDRIRGLGNSVVPQCAREAFKRLCGIKDPSARPARSADLRRGGAGEE